MALSKSRAWLNKRNKDAKQKKDTFIRGWRVPYNRKFVPMFNYNTGRIDKRYLISDHGEVISFCRRSPLVVKQYKPHDYNKFKVRKKDVFTHVVVWLSFAYQYYCVSSKGYKKPDCSDKIESPQDFNRFLKLRLGSSFEEIIIHHKDGDRLNNDISNLMLVYTDAHKAYHAIKDLKLTGNDSNDMLSMSALPEVRALEKPTMFNIDGGKVSQIITLDPEGIPYEKLTKDLNTIIRYKEPLIKAHIYAAWIQLVNDNLQKGTKPCIAKVELPDINQEIFYRIPKSEEQGLSFEEIKDSITRIPRRERGIDIIVRMEIVQK